LTRASKLSPTWWVPYRNLALSRLVENDTPGAIAQYEEAIKAAPSENGLIVELASLLERQGRVDDAIRRYEASYAATHNRMIANNLAMLLVTYKKDRTSLDRARDLTRGFDSATEGDLLDTNGWVHFKRAEYADALPVLERAAQRVPDSRVIHYHLGMAELQAGRTDRARADLQTAVSGSATFPGLDEARTALAALKSET
jgi:Flp pilus assembly protein TadD